MSRLFLRQTKLSKVELWWQSIIFLILAYTALEVPLVFATQYPFEKWQVFIDVIFSIVFAVDLYHNTKIKKRLIKDRIYSYKKQHKAWYTDKALMIDLVACIPFDLIAFLTGIETYLRFFRLLKLLRLMKIQNLNRNVGSFAVLPSAVRVEIVIICSVIAINWIASGWILVNPMSGGDIYTYYNKSLYWAITTLTTIGYGDVVPTTNLGRSYTMVIMIIGVGVYGFVIGNVFNLISQADRYKEQTKEKINDLSLFMKHYDIPDQLQYAVFSYYNHLFTKRLSENDTNIISDLPNALQSELQTYMNMKLIGSVPSFKLCSHSCLKEIASALDQKFFSPGQMIINKGEVGFEMYIIAHGVVEILGEDMKIITSLHEGQCFGELALLEETTRSANVKAQTYCDLYKLSKEDFTRIQKKHPELEKSMLKDMKLHTHEEGAVTKSVTDTTNIS